MIKWEEGADSMNFRCGYCDKEVASNEGYKKVEFNENEKSILGVIYICPGCKNPTFFSYQTYSQVPSPMIGNKVESLPSEVEKIYNEARECIKIGAYSACVLLCRKLLMHIAVREGADPGWTFLKYIEYLKDQGYISKKNLIWVDFIRQKGNSANHEIELISRDDSLNLLTFSEVLLKTIYEFPSKLL